MRDLNAAPLRRSTAEFVLIPSQAIPSDRSISGVKRTAINAGLPEDFPECDVTTNLTVRQKSLRVLKLRCLRLWQINGAKIRGDYHNPMRERGIFQNTASNAKAQSLADAAGWDSCIRRTSKLRVPVKGDSTALPMIVARYLRRERIIRELRHLCIDDYLLSQPDGGRREGPQLSSRLAHDAVAPNIRIVYESSEAMGPRARRILEQRVRGWRHDTDKLVRTVLSSIELGLQSMRYDENESAGETLSGL
jgi:hypothetical protein